MNIQIGLHGGGRFRIVNGVPDVADVTPRVLAFGLAHVTRFGGQAGPYVVGEHSVRMYRWAKKDRQDRAILRAILLHDTPECLGEGDHQRFVKRAFFGDGPHKYASLVCTALWQKFIPADRGSAVWTWPLMYEAVKVYDEDMGSLEARAFGFPHDPISEYVDCTFTPNPDSIWSAEETVAAYLQAWSECD